MPADDARPLASGDVDVAGGLDGVVERVGRWAAARSTRRSFLGRLGRVAVLVAGGPALVSLLAEPASARVCGQSGVSPKCPTFDCDETWGWCWYASGCCAGGLLKKICDCCAPNTPNPRGYCPSGTEVLCIMESCGADPRLQTVALTHLTEQDPVQVAVAVSQQRYPRGGVPMAVIGDAESPQMSALAISAGRVAGGPVFLTKRPGLDVAVGEELERLGVRYATIIGPHLEDRVETHLRDRGVEPHRVGDATEVGALSVQVAVWSRELTGKRAVMVLRPRVADQALAAAAAYCHESTTPLLIGDNQTIGPALDDPRRVNRTIVVSDDADDAEGLPGGEAVTAVDAAGFATVIAGLDGLPSLITLAAVDVPGAALGAATMPATLFLHQPGALDGAREALFANREEVVAAYVIDRSSAFPAEARYELQSILNEYETHLLIGSAGEGLPVIPQPYDERPIGKARDTRPADQIG